VYGTDGTALVDIGADTPVDAVLNAFNGDVNINYAVDCQGVDRIAVAVYESDAFSTPGVNLVYSTDLGPNPPLSIPCGTSFTIPSMPAPAYYEFHFISALDSTGQALDQVCSRFIQHTASASFHVDTYPTWQLEPATGQCP
jgi:hypothetical protein